MPSNKKLLQAAAGNAGGDPLYAEDVFSTYLYEGNGFYPSGGGQTITNGIDLDGEGGMVWIKARNTDSSHGIYDTERGINKMLGSNLTAQEYTDNAMVSANSDGFTLGAESSGWTRINFNGYDYASWTFRKAEKFFDVVTYTGNGVAGRTVAHNLGSTPACMIVKRTNASQGWAVYHVGMDATNPENWMMRLNATDARFDLTPSRWNDTAPTSTDFTLSDNDEVNGNGSTYVAYLFASDAGGFGDDGSENIIKCGSYTVDGSGYSPNVELGFEPQWVLMKPATVNGTAWVIMDTMRGWVNNGTAADDANLRPNAADAEAVNDIGWPYSTGFYAGYRGNPGAEWIYIAIRRPMKTPESGTEVFGMATATNTDPLFVTGLVTDLGFYKYLVNTGGVSFGTRLLQGTQLDTATTAAEGTQTAQKFDYQNGFRDEPSPFASTQFIGYGLKRATGFMDVVAYTGTGTNPTNFSHNLNVVPELMIFKKRSASDRWEIYSAALGNSKRIDLNTNGAATTNTSIWGGTPTATQFSLTDNPNVNQTGQTYISYLFATVAGVSKVGSVVHSSTTNVDCGFSAGARFVIVKRTDASGNWYVWDTTQGIVAGDSPFWQLNGGTAQVTNTDYIDPLSSGFTLTSSFTAGTYIFLAIA